MRLNMGLLAVSWRDVPQVAPDVGDVLVRSADIDL